MLVMMINELMLFIVIIVPSWAKCTFHCLSSSLVDIDLKRTVSERLCKIIFVDGFLEALSCYVSRWPVTYYVVIAQTGFKFILILLSFPSKC